MYDRIIVPVDQSGGEEGVGLARAVARQLGAALTLLHVHHTREAPTELEGLPQFRYQHVVEAWDGLDMEEEAHEVEWLASRAADVARAETDLHVTSRVVHAPLARTLRAPGERVLVVATTEGKEAGPTASEILRAGGVPVLLVPADEAAAAASPGHVLIALDGSRFSEEVLEPALELAAALDARITLVEVVTRHQGLSRLLHAGARSREAAEAFLRDVRRRMGPQRRPVEVRVVQAGTPAAALVGEARREKGSVLALATHGRGGLRRLVMGSVADRVVRESGVPVLLLRPTGVAAPDPAPTAA